MKYVYAVGRVDHDTRDIVIVPHVAPHPSDAYDIGKMDAENGNSCCALAYFSRLDDIEQYILGWMQASRN